MKKQPDGCPGVTGSSADLAAVPDPAKFLEAEAVDIVKGAA